MTVTRTAVGWLLLAALPALAACGEPTTAVQDSARCPGEGCADDNRARFDAIGDIGGVIEVVAVTRDYGLDRGASRRAEVVADVDSLREAREVGLAVTRALEDWPGHDDGPAVVVVRAAGEGAAPAETTWLLDDGWVCEQPGGVRRPCGPDNSWLPSGEPVR